jgi:hypothetical protein
MPIQIPPAKYPSAFGIECRTSGRPLQIIGDFLYDTSVAIFALPFSILSNITPSTLKSIKISPSEREEIYNTHIVVIGLRN